MPRSLFTSTQPAVYDGFSPEDRDLFLPCKRSSTQQRLNDLAEQAVEWFTQSSHGDPDAFLDELLRDKVDERMVRKVLGVDRRGRYD